MYENVSIALRISASWKIMLFFWTDNISLLKVKKFVQKFLLQQLRNIHY